MNNFMDNFRRTGRTYNMLEAILKFIYQEKRNCFVIIANEQHKRNIMEQFVSLINPKSIINGDISINYKVGEINFEYYGNVTFISAFSEMWHWDELRLYQAYPDDEIFIDHFAIECKYGKIIELLHKWDKPSKNIENKYLGEFKMETFEI